MGGGFSLRCTCSLWLQLPLSLEGSTPHLTLENTQLAVVLRADLAPCSLIKST